MIVCSDRQAQELLLNDEVDAVVALPEGLLDSLITGGHATITVKAKDPLFGSVVFAVVDRAVDTMDSLQNYALVYMGATEGRFENEDARWDSVRDFNMRLLGDALVRLNGVEQMDTTSPFYRQALMLLLFLVVSCAALFAAIALARLYAQGYARRLYVRGLRFYQVYGAYLLLAVTLGALLSAILGAVMLLFDPGLRFGLLVVSGAVLSCVLAPFFFLFSGTRAKPDSALTRALLGGLGIAFFLLFVGGGFYPSFLMQSSLRLFNPTWLADLLAAWSLGATLDALHLSLFAVPFALCAGVAWYEWRRLL
jgi:hypothetical protein